MIIRPDGANSSLRSALELQSLLLVMLVLSALPALAYPAYTEDPDKNTGYCATCHGDFDKGLYISLLDGTPWNDTLMNTHRDWVNNSCTACHQSPGSVPVSLSSSGNFVLSKSCVGCHGRSQDAGTDTGQPVPLPISQAGAGLRQHHFSAGVMVCANCHGDANPANFTTVGEDVVPYNYGTGQLDGDFNADPCADNQLGATGLDNDGDQVYDGLDTDCGGPGATPGKASQLLVTQHNPAGQTLEISYTPACSADDHSIEFGDLDLVSSYTYAGQECLIGTSGTYVWGYGGSPDSFYFLVVGRNATAEGSYGLDSGGNERPEDTVSGSCPILQDLTNPCN